MGKNLWHSLEMVKNATFSGISRTNNSSSKNPIVWYSPFIRNESSSIFPALTALNPDAHLCYCEGVLALLCQKWSKNAHVHVYFRAKALFSLCKWFAKHRVPSCRSETTFHSDRNTESKNKMLCKCMQVCFWKSKTDCPHLSWFNDKKKRL